LISEIESTSIQLFLEHLDYASPKPTTTHIKSFLERSHILVGTIPIHIDPAFSFHVKSILSSFFRIERKQLEKIFELLREQEDKFQVTSIEQVHDQLSLYR